MSVDEINFGRRRFLTATTLAIGAVGAAFAAVPLISYWLPSERTKAIGAPIDIDVSSLTVGQKVTYSWRGQPIFVIKRSDSVLKNLDLNPDRLRDPNSDVKNQPGYINNKYRSIQDDILVLLGVCTHLGCVPLYKPKAGEVEPSWVGGFFCPCHGSKFDLAGRVFKGVPAPENLHVPPHRFLSNTVLRIGEDTV